MADSYRLFVTRLLDAYTSPTNAFRGLGRQTSVWPPFCGIILITACFLGVWSWRVDPVDFVRARLDESPHAASISAGEREHAIDTAAQNLLVESWTTALPSAVVWVFVGGLYFYVVLNGLYGTDLSLRQSVAVTAYVSLVVGSVRLPLTCLVLAVRGDWTIPPGSALQASLALLLERGAVGRGVYALAESIDLFSLWSILLRVIGYAVVTRRRAAAISVAALAPWLAYVMAKVALAH